MKLFKKIGIGAAVLTALAGAGYSGAWYFAPLQMSELSNRVALWREGVKPVESAGLKGYVRDTCTDAQGGDARNCTCVAMVHGLADSSMTWKKILLWPANGWQQPMKLYAFDLPGSGQSPEPADLTEYRVRKQGQKLIQALVPLCPTWIVVGNSFGGWVAAWMALDWPKGVSRLLLVDSGGLREPARSEGASASSREEVLKGFETPTVESLKDFQKRAYFKGRPLPDSVWRAAVERMKSSNAKEIIQAQVPEDFLDDRLPSLRKITMVLWGAADRVILPEKGRQLQSLIPGAIWREVPECGHMPQKECPVEVIKAIGNLAGMGGM